MRLTISLSERSEISLNIHFVNNSTYLKILALLREDHYDVRTSFPGGTWLWHSFTCAKFTTWSPITCQGKLSSHLSFRRGHGRRGLIMNKEHTASWGAGIRKGLDSREADPGEFAGEESRRGAHTRGVAVGPGHTYPAFRHTALEACSLGMTPKSPQLLVLCPQGHI